MRLEVAASIDPNLGLPFSQSRPPMNVIARSTLEQFWIAYPDAEQPLKSWFAEVSKAKWSSPQELKVQFRNASVRPGRRVVFNVKGNDYRLVVAIAYRFQAVYIKFIGTHEQYDAIDVDTVGGE